MLGEAHSPFRDARGKLVEIDTSAPDIAIEKRRESMQRESYRVDATSRESVEPSAESWRETDVRA